MDLRNQLQNLSMEELAKVHEVLGLDEEYPYSDYECKGDYIMHIFEKEEADIIRALNQVSSKNNCT